jgi:hypothetical protein
VPVLVQDLQEVLVDVLRVAEAVLDLVHVVDRLVKLDRLLRLALALARLPRLALLALLADQVLHADLEALRNAVSRPLAAKSDIWARTEIVCGPASAEAPEATGVHARDTAAR